MQQTNRNSRSLSAGLIATLSLALLAGCGGGGTTTPPDADFDADALLTRYAEDVVLQTYEDLADQGVDLEAAVNTLVATPNVANLSVAQDVWREARAPWEKSEGFLFGPVDNLGLDPALDSWPVNRTDLDAVLASATPLTEASVATFQDTLRGFHTIEYLLFDDGNGNRSDANIVAALAGDARRRDYLAAVTANLQTNTETLAAAWRDTDGNFVEEFLTAGEGSTTYPSQRSAMQEIVEGMKTIADEVANGKINDPFSQADGTLEESQFSDNSLEDFRNNMLSIQNGYLGSYDGTRDSDSLSAFVASEDATLDSDLRDQIEDTLDALDAIPEPFRTSLTDPAAADEIQAAIDAINVLFDTLDTELTALINSTEFER